MVSDFVKAALSEDVGRGDLFSRVVEKKSYSAVVICKDNGVLAGQTYALEICAQCNVDIVFLKHDGDSVSAGETIATVRGTNTDVLACERTLLNVLQHASGIATNVRKYSDVTNGYNIKLLDTRKTRPLLRIFEKYASSIGGAVNHRLGLDDCLMIKDTHRKSIADMESFLCKARNKIPFTSKIELECETVVDAIGALSLDIDILMCDNMSVNDVKSVVDARNKKASKILIEASGGINQSNIESYCSTGVDAISVGSLVHHAVWLDFSMKGI